ncbi:thiamine phosphate synthase [Chryseosolibacter indicus]|nr:thiamine phosphate synthase [Chryseosolibacter indicus]
MKIDGGLYLVVDPRPGLQDVFPKIKEALEGGVDVIQLWNSWNLEESQEELILSICDLAHQYQVPVLINEHWRYLEKFPLDGVHFDEIPLDLAHIRQSINRSFFIGITCGNDQLRVDWAVNNNIDYISFCSMFPSSTANSCDLVNPDFVRQVRANTHIPVYVAGGITLDNLPAMMALGIDGVAVVSEIMKSSDPRLAANRFKQTLNHRTLNHPKRNETIFSK